MCSRIILQFGGNTWIESLNSWILELVWEQKDRPGSE